MSTLNIRTGRRTALEAAATRERIRVLISSGMRWKDIAREVGTGVAYVHKVAAKAGLKKMYLTPQEAELVEVYRRASLNP